MLNRNLFLYLFAYIAPAAIGFFAVALYTHLLSPAEYGHYVIGMSLAGIVNMLCFVWIRLSVSRYQASSPELDLRGTAILSYCATVAVIATLTPLALLLTPSSFDHRIALAAVAMALAASAFEIGQEFRRAKLEPLRFTAVAMLRSALGLGLGFAAIKLGFGGVGLLAAIAVSFFAGSLLQVGRAGPGFRLVDREHLACFARYGLPLSLSGLAFSLYSSGDRLVVAFLLGEEAAGHYGVAADLTRQIIVLLASSCASATVPLVFRALASDGPAAARARLNDSAELLLAIVLPVAAWLAVSADVFSSVFLGPEFRAEVPVLLPLLAAARLFGAISQFYFQLSFQLAERPLLQVMQEVLILVASFCMMVPLAYAFGLPGAAAATVLTEAVALSIGWMLSKRAFVIPVDVARLGRVVLASAALMAAAYGAKLAVGHAGWVPLIAVFAAGALAYAAVALAFDIARVRTTLVALARPYLAGLRSRVLFRGQP